MTQSLWPPLPLPGQEPPPPPLTQPLNANRFPSSESLESTVPVHPLDLLKKKEKLNSSCPTLLVDGWRRYVVAKSGELCVGEIAPTAPRAQNECGSCIRGQGYRAARGRRQVYGRLLVRLWCRTVCLLRVSNY